MNRRTFLATAATAAVTSPLLAQPKEKVKIVSSLPRTGSAKGQTDGIVNAIQMAIDDFKKDVPFEVAYLDWDDATAAQGQWVAEKEKENAEKAVADKDVLAFIGPYNSGAARVSMPILNEGGLVQVSPACSWPGLTKKAPTADADEPEKYRPTKKLTFCRVCPHDASQGPLAADFAATELKVKKVYVLDDKELYGNGLAVGFKKQCEQLKIEVLGHESIDVNANNFKELLKKIKKKNPDLIYFGGMTQTKAGQLVKDMKAEGVNCPFLAPDGCYEQAFIDSAGADALDAIKCFVTVSGIDPAHLKGRGADFVKRYKTQHKKDAEPYAVYGYEAAAVVMVALMRAGKKDRAAVLKEVLSTKDFEKGALNKWSFDADGDTTQQPVTVTIVETGKFKSVKVMGAQ